MRIIFFGTPEFAIPALEALAAEHEVALVVAQPDRPAGRGMKMQAPAAAVRARELGLPLVQPSKIRTEEFLSQIAAAAPEVGIVIAYGRILPKSLLDIPKHGFLNVHGSVLPKWRGAAPIQRSIEAGDDETGVTIMRVDEELDHGPMFAIATTPIGPDERTPSLTQRLAQLGVVPLLETLRALEDGTATEAPQDHAQATFAPKIEKQEGEVRFTENAATIYNRFRAFDPWPGLFIRSGEETIKLTEIRTSDRTGEPRTILDFGESVTVATADGAIEILEMQRPGKPRTAAGVVARALEWRAGLRIED
jgi:methionyl-tRNA formyltransferase